MKNLSLLRWCVIACLVLSQPFHNYKETQYSELSFFTAFSSWHIAPEENIYLESDRDFYVIMRKQVASVH